MLVRTMKTFGAAVVFLAVINVLTVSSTPNVTDATSSPTTTGHQESTTALTSTQFISTSPTRRGIEQSSPTTGSTVSTEDASTARTSRKPTISTVSSTDGVTNTTDGVTTGSTTAPTHDKVSSIPPIEKKTTSASAQDPSIGTKTTQVTKEGASRPSSEPQPATIDNKSKDKKTDENGDVEKRSATGNKGIKIGAGCVAAVIAVIVLVVIYKICQKKPPAPENPEMKASTEKENVKLVSVKTETPNSDTKRTSSNQMEGIEC